MVLRLGIVAADYHRLSCQSVGDRLHFYKVDLSGFRTSVGYFGKFGFHVNRIELGLSIVPELVEVCLIIRR